MKIQVSWGYFTYRGNDTPRETVLGNKECQVPDTASLEFLRQFSKEIVISGEEPTMTDFLSTQLNASNSKSWRLFPSVKRERAPSVVARRWLWLKTNWHDWQEPVDSLVNEGYRLNYRWTYTKRCSPHNSFLPEEPARYQRGYYCIAYPAGIDETGAS